MNCRRVPALAAFAAAALLISCGPDSGTSLPPVLTDISVKGVQAGQSRDLQIGVIGENFQPRARVLFDTVPIPTAFADSHVVTSDIPGRLLERARTIQIRVENPDGRVSRPAPFVISPTG